MKHSGKIAWVFPHNYDVDYIIGIPNIGLRDIRQIVDCLMRDQDPDFLQQVSAGDILVAGKNFGYGHAHPQPMEGMRAVGISTIIAESYTFPFYRSELASGMKMYVCSDITKYCRRGETLIIDTDENAVILQSGERLNLKPLQDYPMRLMENDGVVSYIEKWKSKEI